jgi:hypothetical protein
MIKFLRADKHELMTAEPIEKFDLHQDGLGSGFENGSRVQPTMKESP